MTHGGSSSLMRATRALLLVAIFAIPLFVLPITLEAMEINKQTLLLILVGTSAITWLAAQLAERALTIRRGWVNALPAFFFLAFCIPAFHSVAPYLSWIGAHRQEYTSVLTIGAIALLMYLLTNTMKTRAHHQAMHLTLIGSATLSALITVIELMGGSILDPSLAANTVGTVSTFVAFLIIMQSLFISAWLAHKPGDSLFYKGGLGTLTAVLGAILVASTMYLLLVIDDSMLWLLQGVSVSIMGVCVLLRAKAFREQSRMVVPVILLLMSIGFGLWLPGIQQTRLPAEITLNTYSSELIAMQVLQYDEAGTWGSGPGTYQYMFSKYKPESLNETDVWNARFDRASTAFWTWIATIGVGGLLFLLVFVTLLGARALKQVLHPKSRDEWVESFVHVIPWVTTVVSAFVLPWNLTLMVTFGVFSGLLASQVVRKQHSISLSRAAGIQLILSMLMIIGGVGLLAGLVLTGGRYAAEIAFAKAVAADRAGAPLQEVVQSLDRASSINPYHDTYHRNLAEALLLRLSEELAGIESLETLSAESTQYIQGLTAASVNAAVQATTRSPHNVLNWLTRGHIYRELTGGLTDAGPFAIESYQEAIRLEPGNPQNWTELGKTYLVVAEQVRPITASTDEAVAAQATKELNEYLRAAEQAFAQAIALKPSYAPAHFQTAVAYERQGRIDDAVGKMESVAQYNQLDVGVQFQLGMLYLQRAGTGDIERAQTALEQAVKLAPEYANAYWFLATIYEQQGNLSAAAQAVEMVVKLNPGNDIASARLERLLKGEFSTAVPQAIE